MIILARQLRERAKQLGISNAEAARRSGLEEGRYGHYIAGRREPDLATLCRIAKALGTSPNWLLEFQDPQAQNSCKASLTTRFAHAAGIMTCEELELCVVQAEAIAARAAAKPVE